MKGAILLFLTCLAFSVHGQKVFSENDLLLVVRKFHPVAKQALLNMRIADANITASRGAFDPVVNFANNRKDFERIAYYDQQHAEIKIPTWYGLDIYAGTEYASGNKLNPEETRGTVNYAGVSVPLIQNLVTDKRRAALKQAEILKQEAEVTRLAALNDLIAEAAVAYWDWWEQHQLVQVVQTSLQNARSRLAMVRTAHQLGDRPAIDTLEAVTQVQLLEQQQNEAILLLEKSRLQLSLYLWKERDVPYELPGDAAPEKMQFQKLPLLDSLLAQAGLQPLLVEYDFRLKRLEIEKRLKFQSLLPEVVAKYNYLSRDLSKTLDAGFFRNNYRFGLSFSMPLRLSEGRGEYRASKLKIEQARLSQLAKQVAVQNKVKQFYIEWQQTTLQYRQQQKLVENYLALQKGEETRLGNGESSLFLVNAREVKTIEGRGKELSLAAKILKAAVRVKGAAGMYSKF